ncbi:mitochondrial FAD-linked sulfhydryl oxidase [Nematocida major]|uniref:mitochondrial FAD-linked sulfhydryl oxidase n=1 Tax=Nematocida major TaxID=1912982 RepID=UPI0020075FAE|nr:mitochondrial FAD-linked sulfhydryl oxidase [Nematocida major]KAH9386143.1 mitochondrial FAD-linked sulfhydryl oxidase [Nematocida major]
MRKQAIVVRVFIGIVAVWVVLTGYKMLRRYRTPRKDAGPFYAMPESAAERRGELGRGTWTLIHTIAAKYPAEPTREYKGDVLKFVELLTKLFPCEDCRGHFKKLVGGFPPKVSSREEFSLWACQAHNIVNRRLGKTEFECSRLDERWDCGCKA